VTTKVPTPPKSRNSLSPRAFRLMIRLAFEADRWGSALLCLSIPSNYLAPTLGAVATKSLVDAAVAGDTATAVVAGVLAALMVACTLGSFVLDIYLIHAIGKKVDALVERRLAELITGVPGIEHYERPDYLDEVQLLREQSGHLGAGLNSAMQMLARVLQVVVVCALLAAQTPLLLLLPLLAVPSFIATGIGNRLNHRAHEATAEPDRLLHRLVGLVGDLPVAREARLFGYGDDLRARRGELAATVDSTRGRAMDQIALLGLAGNLVFAVGYLGAVLLVVRRALQGELTAGDVALTVVLAGQVQGFISGLVDGTRFLMSVSIVAARLNWLQAYDRAMRPATATSPVPDRLRRGIRLDRVSFRYPGTERLVLDDITCDLPAGAAIALVGENGAGKSSLVKLLLRFYEPTAGRLLVDDIPVADLDLSTWRRRASGGFQDFCRFEFLARESIGLGDVRQIDDAQAVLAAAAASGADEVVRRLPDGLDTQLGAGWEGGVDLSGGQWQRVALARARMRDSPLLLVLDEPTAALDAAAEHALFERFTAATQDARTTGGVTLLVTHRFSTVRMADLILVLDGGRIREYGCHADLIRSRGLYAELYDLQASAYR
jgi:ATP-binding cassette, subfamily B, bacterial